MTSDAESNNVRDDWKRLIRTFVSICISVVSLTLAALYVFVPNAPTRWHLDGKVVGLLVAAALPWLMERLESFKGFGFEFTQRLDAQNAIIEAQQQLLNLMFWFSMEADMFDTLKNLVDQQDFTYNPKDQWVYAILGGQLKELFNKGYVNRHPDSIPPEENIGRGKIVTVLGKTFVTERKKLEAAGAIGKLQALSPISEKLMRD